VARLTQQVETGRARVEQLRELIARAEEEVIASAKVVATTLTSAYLRDAIVNRRFDVVLLDEASMAPIPPLFFAASRAISSVVVVGDFRQLPPIVIADEPKNPLAKKWLGTDIFELAGVTRYEHEDNPPPWFVLLREQKRMHPAISRPVNDLIYAGKLRDGSLREQRDQWLSAEWPYPDERVLLVDLSDTGAWASRVASGRRSSKVNFYSATACVDLAGALLGADRHQGSELDEPRVAIISRYRPHASLCELLIEQRDLLPDVQAGTAHSFQGAEADAVILDIVDAPPVWKAGLFMPDQDNDANQRLLNVAVTRAKQRLLIVGDFDWVRTTGKHSFLNRLLAHLGERHRVVPIEQLIPQALHERVAATRGLIIGSRQVDTEHAIADEQAYYDLLRQDLGRARVILSPFLTVRRVLDLQAELRAALDRGVRVVVVSKPPFGADRQPAPGAP